MKLIGLLFTIIVFISFLSFSTFSQSNFEGKVVIHTTDKEGSNQMDYYVKSGKVRMDVKTEMGEAYVIFNKEKNQMFMILPQNKMYMEYSMDMMNNPEAQKEMKKVSENLKKTGETKDINGYSCEKFIISDEDGSSEAWMTKELGGFMFFDSPMGNQSKPSWQKEIELSGYFPMFVIERDTDGNETNRFEVKSVEKMSLEDSFFAPPSGFQKMQMPGMGK